MESWCCFGLQHCPACKADLLHYLWIAEIVTGSKVSSADKQRFPLVRRSKSNSLQPGRPQRFLSRHTMPMFHCERVDGFAADDCAQRCLSVHFRPPRLGNGAAGRWRWDHVAWKKPPSNNNVLQQKCALPGNRTLLRHDGSSAG